MGWFRLSLGKVGGPISVLISGKTLLLKIVHAMGDDSLGGTMRRI